MGRAAFAAKRIRVDALPGNGKQHTHVAAQRLVNEASTAFKRDGDPTVAKEQTRYMKGLFSFIGLKAPTRRCIAAKVIVDTGIAAEQMPASQEFLTSVLATSYKEKERELHQFGIDFFLDRLPKALKDGRCDATVMDALETAIITHSWWDSVDALATRGVGEVAKYYPKKLRPKLNSWVVSDNIWLRRSAIIYQLKHKKETDKVFLTKAITGSARSKEYFLRKAIGWALREYAKTDPVWVQSFVKIHEHELSKLSLREALKKHTAT